MKSSLFKNKMTQAMECMKASQNEMKTGFTDEIKPIKDNLTQGMKEG